MIYNARIKVYDYSERTDDYGQVQVQYTPGIEHMACFQPLRFRELEVMYTNGLQADFVLYTAEPVVLNPGDKLEVTHVGETHICDVIYVERWDNHTKVYARYIQRVPTVLEHN